MLLGNVEIYSCVSTMDNNSTIVLNGTKFAPIGRCIYCGATNDLETEHIMPFGLSGTAKLPQSSCRACAKITGAVEQLVLHGPLWPVRVFRNLKSRTKHRDAPKTLPLTLFRNGYEETIQLGIDEYPMLLHFPVFTPPSYLTQAAYSPGIGMLGVASVLFGPRPNEVCRSLGATAIKLTADYQKVAFARMIAKIGYSFAVAMGAINSIDGEALLLEAILGIKDDIGRWVGTLTKPFEKHPDHLHQILVHQEREKGLLIAEVQLFSDSQTPSYGVIIGKLKPQMSA